MYVGVEANSIAAKVLCNNRSTPEGVNPTPINDKEIIVDNIYVATLLDFGI